MAVDDARERVAGLLGADLGEVVFTGGGTEADNLAVLGTLAAAVPTAGRPDRWCARPWSTTRCSRPAGPPPGTSGSSSGRCPSDAGGHGGPRGLAEACTPDVALVSVMVVNNEVGTIQPLDEVARLVRRNSPGACSTPTPCRRAWLDLAGIAALVRPGRRSAPTSSGARRGWVRWWCATASGLEPVVHGGGQERERRSGTQDVAGIVAMAAALAVTAARRQVTGAPGWPPCATAWPTACGHGPRRCR